MITVRQIERLWHGGQYQRLFHDLLAVRAEASMALSIDPTPTATAAVAFIRLDELAQSFTPICGKLLTTLLASQQADGGWGDLPTTALALRALLCGRGHGLAIDRGLGFLANLQKSEGIWPTLPLRRTAADSLVSAFILYELGNQPMFQNAVRFDQALHWFAEHAAALDDDGRRLWHHASLRCRRPAAVALWS